jgi:hypothetical protein
MVRPASEISGPKSINFNWPDTTNLVAVITPFSKALLEKLGYEDDFEILKRRHGLEGSKDYTLKEIGDNLGITRQRVQQREVRAAQKIGQVLFGSNDSAVFQVPVSFTQEANELKKFLSTKDVILTEDEIISIIRERCTYDFDPQDVGALRLLLSVFDFNQLPQKVSSFRELLPAWITLADKKKVDKKLLLAALPAVRRILWKKVIPLALFDLTAQVNKKQTKRITPESIRLAIKVCSEIECVNADTYQIKIEYLRSLADQAYRILRERDQPMHIRDIHREMKQRLTQAGCPAKSPLKALQTQLVSNKKRFAPIGCGGYWSLLEWSNVPRGTIVELIEEIFNLRGARATLDEVYEYVISKRADVERGSVLTYLSAKEDKFVKVSKTEYELTSWGTPSVKSGIPRPRAEPVRAAIRREVEAYLKQQPDNKAPVNNVASHVMKATRCPRPTFYAYLSEMQNIRKEQTENELYCFLAGPVALPSDVEQITDETLKAELKKAFTKLNIDDADMGLFMLGRTFEGALKNYLKEVQARNVFAVTQANLGTLKTMIDCVEHNGIITAKADLTSLREERNARAHGSILSLAEREELLQRAPHLAGLYVLYIVKFSKMRDELIGK